MEHNSNITILKLPTPSSGKNCGDECDNNRIYVSGLPSTITEKDLVDKFGTIGIIARVRQVRKTSKQGRCLRRYTLSTVE